MASSAVQGFVQGFAGTLAPIILERKKEARDYFNKQVEYARTTGLQNRQRVRQEADATLGVARQLEAIGVPKEVIMAQVNQDPSGLGSFYQGIDKLNVERASKGLPALTSTEIAGLVNVGGNFKAPDEDLATFISRTYEPMSRAVTDPGFSANPENSLWASMMGYSAMDEARAELGNTVIAEGMTADDLINYGDAQPQKIGGQAVVTTNYTGLPVDAEKPVSPSDAGRLMTDVAENWGRFADRDAIVPGGDATATVEAMTEYMAEIYSPAIPVEEIRRRVEAFARTKNFEVAPTASPEAPTEATEEVGIGDSPEPTMPPAEAPAASGEGLSPAEITMAKSIAGVTDVVDNGDGTVTLTINGEERTDTIEKFRASVARIN